MVSDKLVKLGVPLRAAMLYGRLAYRAAIGKHDLNHGELAKEIGLGTRQHVQRLLKLLQRLRLIEWKRSRYWNIYRVLDPDATFLLHLKQQPRCNFPVASDATFLLHLDARYKEVRSKREENTPYPQPSPSPKPDSEPEDCATDVARVSGKFSLPKNKPSGGDRQAEWFSEFWAAYWRRVARKPAEKAFRVHVKTEERFQQVMAAVKRQLPGMMEREPDKRPHGATWLNAERWNDEPEAPARVGPQQAKSYSELPRLKRS
jgi:hypothetical protein